MKPKTIWTFYKTFFIVNISIFFFNIYHKKLSLFNFHLFSFIYLFWIDPCFSFLTQRDRVKYPNLDMYVQSFSLCPPVIINLRIYNIGLVHLPRFFFLPSFLQFFIFLPLKNSWTLTQVICMFTIRNSLLSIWLFSSPTYIFWVFFFTFHCFILYNGSSSTRPGPAAVSTRNRYFGSFISFFVGFVFHRVGFKFVEHCVYLPWFLWLGSFWRQLSSHFMLHWWNLVRRN